MRPEIKKLYNAVITAFVSMLILQKILKEPSIETQVMIGVVLVFFVLLFYYSAINTKIEIKQEVIELDRKQAIKRADKYFSLYIRHKYPVCVICKKEATDCGHFIRREILATRWLEENAFSLCRECNMKHETNPEPYTNFYKAHYGEDFIEALNSFKYDNSIKLHTKDIIDIGTYYKEKLYSGDKYCLPPECLVKIKKKLYEKVVEN